MFPRGLCSLVQLHHTQVGVLSVEVHSHDSVELPSRQHSNLGKEIRQEDVLP